MRRVLFAIDSTLGILFRFTAVITSMALMGLILFYLVLFRYVLELPTTYAGDIINLSAMWLYMAGMILASRNKDHLRIDFLEKQIKKPLHRCIQQLVVALITSIVCIFFVYLAYLMMIRGFKRPQTTPTGILPLWTLQITFMVSSIFCLMYAIRDVFYNVGQLRTKQYKEFVQEN